MMNEFELGILDTIGKAMHCRALDLFFSIFTQFGGVPFMITLAVILLLLKKTRRVGFTVSLALILGLIVGNLILKNVFSRIRPYDLNDTVKLIVSAEHNYSFPSAHTAASFEVAVVIWFYNKKIGIFAIISAVLIAFSRLYLYVHYPSDVLAGAVLGTAIAFLSYRLLEKNAKLKGVLK